MMSELDWLNAGYLVALQLGLIWLIVRAVTELVRRILREILRKEVAKILEESQRGS